jgi:site-specific recombinase XerD
VLEAMGKEYRKADPKTEDPTFVIYDFRHTFATRMAKGGCDIATLAKILGHGNLRSVQKYIHIDEEHVKLAMQRYGHWPAGTPNAHKSLPSGPAAMQ